MRWRTYFGGKKGGGATGGEKRWDSVELKRRGGKGGEAERVKWKMFCWIRIGGFIPVK